MENATLRNSDNSRVSAIENKHSRMVQELVAKKAGCTDEELQTIKTKIDLDASGLFKAIDEKHPIE